jgi:hypothetical protein
MSDNKLSLTEHLSRACAGEVIYTEHKDTAVGAYAKRAGVKIATQRVLAILGNEREVIDLTRIVITEAAQEAPASIPPKRVRRSPSPK